MKHILMIGSPVGHVRSPGLLNAMFEAAGEDARVLTQEVGEAGLPQFIEEWKNIEDLIGLIVTTPLKQAICSHLKYQTCLVSFIGAANCVRLDEGQWIGANFDGYGLLEGLQGASGTVLLVGCGGAGRAIAAALVRSGEVKLTLYDINTRKAEALASQLGQASARTLAGEFDVVINASQAGMRRGDPSPIPKDIVARARTVVDIVIGPAESHLERDALELHKTFIAGHAMVAGQAPMLRQFLMSNARSEEETVSMLKRGADRP